MKKTKIIVLMGGKSSEHDVSLMSGKEVVKNLDSKKYQITPIIITKDGTGLEKISKTNTDIVFIALHGNYGEDGKIQGFLETMGFDYTGSGVLASAVGMDKIIFRKLMQTEKVRIPKYFLVKKGDDISSVIPKNFKAPYFVKPYDQGSSVGVSFVKKRSDLERAVKLAFRYSEIALVDEYIAGTEIACAILGNSNPVALPVIEIHPLVGEYFDFKSKYSKNGSLEIVPANISKKITEKVQKIAIKVYKKTGCHGFGRVDFILKDDKIPVLLEINTIPGLTSESLLPKAAKAAGMTYPQLLDEIIDFAKS
jgi:D-alanine-D-alanine ligase